MRDNDQALTRFSISRKSREEMVHFFLSRAGALNFHFSRRSRLSRFWRKNSRSPLEIRDLEKKSRGNGPFFSISTWRIEFPFLDMLSIVKIFKKKIHSPLKIKDFEEISLSLLELMRFCKQILIQNFERKNSLSPVDSSLNFSSNSREKSYFAVWVDFDQQCFAEGESILTSSQSSVDAIE